MTTEQLNMYRTLLLEAAASICARRADRFYYPQVATVTDLEIARRTEAEQCAKAIRAAIQTDEQAAVELQRMANGIVKAK